MSNQLLRKLFQLIFVTLFIIAVTVPTGPVFAIGGPTNPPPPAYPTLGLPPSGAYQAPTVLPVITWKAFPAYPNNFMLPPWKDPSNCVTESTYQWYLCAYAQGWKVAIRPPGLASYWACMLDQLHAGYMRITCSNGKDTSVFENATYVVISDGVHVMIVRQNVSWGKITYDYGFLR